MVQPQDQRYGRRITLEFAKLRMQPWARADEAKPKRAFHRSGKPHERAARAPKLPKPSRVCARTGRVTASATENGLAGSQLWRWLGAASPDGRCLHKKFRSGNQIDNSVRVVLQQNPTRLLDLRAYMSFYFLSFTSF